MSKIFEALSRAKSTASDVLMPALDGVTNLPVEEPQAQQPQTPTVADHPLAAPVLPADAPGTIGGLGSFRPRTLPMRLQESSPLLPFEGNWRVSEQYRMIRTKLVQHRNKPRMITVSSSGPGDGKSVTAVNLAGVLALKTDGKVLLIDGDFRRSSIHTQLGLPLETGLADVLVGSCSLESALIHTEQLENLYVLTAGGPRENPVELLDSAYWRSLCERLRTLFRYIIVDCPPVGAVADYDLLQASSDGVIMVVRPDHSSRMGSLRAIESVPKDKMLGVVMNCAEDWFLTKAYRYDAYYNYR